MFFFLVDITRHLWSNNPHTGKGESNKDSNPFDQKDKTKGKRTKENKYKIFSQDLSIKLDYYKNERGAVYSGETANNKNNFNLAKYFPEAD